jgi:hypothetical protein
MFKRKAGSGYRFAFERRLDALAPLHGAAEAIRPSLWLRDSVVHNPLRAPR